MDTNAKKGKAPKYPCLRCKKAVEKDQRSVQCQTCQLWVHTECENISDELFKILADSENYGGVCWNCTSCLASTARLERHVIALESRVKEVETVMIKTTSEIKRVDDSVAQLRREFEAEREKTKLAEQQKDEMYVSREEYRERESRKCNVVMHRIKEPGESLKSGNERLEHDLEQCKKILRTLEMVEEAKSGIKFARRIGERGQEPRPLVVILRTEDVKRKLLDSAQHLRESEFQEVGIVPDLTIQQRREEQQMVENVERMNEEELTAEDRAKNLQWVVVGPRGAIRIIKRVPREQHWPRRGAGGGLVRGGARGGWRRGRGAGARGGFSTGANQVPLGALSQIRLEPPTLLPSTDRRTRLGSKRRLGENLEGEEDPEEADENSRTPARKK